MTFDRGNILCIPVGLVVSFRFSSIAPRWQIFEVCFFAEKNFWCCWEAFFFSFFFGQRRRVEVTDRRYTLQGAASGSCAIYTIFYFCLLNVTFAFESWYVVLTKVSFHLQHTCTIIYELTEKCKWYICWYFSVALLIWGLEFVVSFKITNSQQPCFSTVSFLGMISITIWEILTCKLQNRYCQTTLQ